MLLIKASEAAFWSRNRELPALIVTGGARRTGMATAGFHKRVSQRETVDRGEFAIDREIHGN
jgi:hypothetical protein